MDKKEAKTIIMEDFRSSIMCFFTVLAICVTSVIIVYIDGEYRLKAHHSDYYLRGYTP